MADLLARSEWVGGRPGLREQATEWFEGLPAVRSRTDERAARLARPSLHPASVRALADTGARLVEAEAPDVIGDLITAIINRLPLVSMLWKPTRPGGVARMERLVKAGGPVYVKLGQFVATAQGLMPDEWVSAFSWCRDEVPPLNMGTAERIITRAFGQPVGELFADFDPVPLAAASIAQVHAAQLHDGTEVVVKVRRPGLQYQLERDIRALALLAAIVERASLGARIGNVSGFVELFASLVFEEVDFRLEALNMIEVALASEYAGHSALNVPRPIPRLVTQRVLVMERMPGVRYTDALAAYPGGVDGPRLVRLAIEAVVEHTLVYGVFHGDLHAGNVLVDEAGGISLVDFGIVCRLSEDQRVALVRFIVASITEDIDGQINLLQEFGAIPEDADVVALRRAFEGGVERRRDFEFRAGSTPVPFDDVTEDVALVMGMLNQTGYRIPKELLLFLKNVLYLNGFAAALAPELDLLAEIEPVLMYFVVKHPEFFASMPAGGAGWPS